ncbi:STAS domain-containing protein [Streptomyces exfoliatus]|uniref:STAS domain-containing protein n=1 Tax=Streptomyces exfoliatus TaxID=1905 RepID=UPI0037B1B3BB
MSGVEFCDAAGLNVLVTAGREAGQRSGELRLVSRNESFRRLLESTLLDAGLRVYDSLAHAVLAPPARVSPRRTAPTRRCPSARRRRSRGCSRTPARCRLGPHRPRADGRPTPPAAAVAHAHSPAGKAPGGGSAGCGAPRRMLGGQHGSVGRYRPGNDELRGVRPGGRRAERHRERGGCADDTLRGRLRQGG